MSSTRDYDLPAGVTAEDIGRHLEEYLSSEKNMTTQGAAFSSGYVVQARTNGMRTALGMGITASIKLDEYNGGLHVEVGPGEWADKLGTAALGAIFFPPILFTSVYGIFEQSSLPDAIFDEINHYLYGDPAPEPDTGTRCLRLCPNCGASISEDAKFCPNCGASLAISVCPNCGAKLQPGDKFCRNCGHKLNQ